MPASLRTLIGLVVFTLLPGLALAQPTSKCCCASVANGDFCSTNPVFVTEANMDGACESGFFGTPGPSATYSSSNDTCNGNDVDGCATACASLPVELTQFSAVADAGGVRLHWETATETDNAGFEIQHITTGAFTEIGFVEGQGTTLLPQTYTYHVADLAPGVHRFRLKQVDFDGTAAFSGVVEAFMEVPGDYALSDAYPNPFTDAATFTLAVARTQHVQVEVFDMQGRRVALLHDGPLQADTAHPFVLAAGTLPSGTYLYRATGEHFTSPSRQVMLSK